MITYHLNMMMDGIRRSLHFPSRISILLPSKTTKIITTTSIILWLTRKRLRTSHRFQLLRALPENHPQGVTSASEPVETSTSNSSELRNEDFMHSPIRSPARNVRFDSPLPPQHTPPHIPSAAQSPAVQSPPKPRTSPSTTAIGYFRTYL